MSYRSASTEIGAMLAVAVLLTCMCAFGRVVAANNTCGEWGKQMAFENASGLNCTELLGGLDIVNTNVSDLSGLSTIEIIHQNLYISNNHENLKTLHGLRVRDVGSLMISSNLALETLEGLDFLEKVGMLLIHENPELSSISALANLKTVEYSPVLIYNSPKLTTLRGLEGLTSLPSSLEIYSNDALESLEGLENLRTVGGQIIINDNYALKNITALSNLTGEISGLEIQGNPHLVSLDGLEGLSKLNTFTWIVISGPGDEYARPNADLQNFCAICNATLVNGPTSFIHNYNGNDFTGEYAVRDWSDAGKPCGVGLFCWNASSTPSATPSSSLTPLSPSAAPLSSLTLSLSLPPSPVVSAATPIPCLSPTHLSLTSPPTPPSTSPSAVLTTSLPASPPPFLPDNSCLANCILNVTAAQQAIGAAGTDPAALLAIGKALSQSFSRLNINDTATETVLLSLAAAVAHSFLNVSAGDASMSMAAAALVLSFNRRGIPLGAPLVDEFIAGLAAATSRALYGSLSPSQYYDIAGNGTSMLVELAAATTSIQQVFNIVQAAELLADAHAKSESGEAATEGAISVQGFQGSMVELADGSSRSLGVIVVEIPADEKLTNRSGEYTLASIQWLNHSFPSNNVGRGVVAVVTISMLDANRSALSVTNLSKPIILTLPMPESIISLDNVVCASYDYVKATWVSDGCEVVPERSIDGFIVCSCTHLTDFSVLVTTDGSQTESSNGNGFPTGAIVGIAIGGACVVFACVAVVVTIVVIAIAMRATRFKTIVLEGSTDTYTGF